jgi:proline iminopeptidase
MKKKLFLGLAYSFLLSGLLFLIYIFYPRKYDVLPYQEMSNTKYWNLSTGSNIGYVLLEGKGPKKRHPIIYLHGGPGGVITEHTISMLTPFSEVGYDVYAYDQIGSGSSERLDDIEQYTLARHMADLKEIIDQVNSEQVILLGQSWGGVLANFFTVDNAEKVAKIIMTGPGPVFPVNSNLADISPPDSLNIKAPIYSNQDGIRAVYTFRDKCIRWYASALGKKLIPDQQVDDFMTHLNSYLNRSTLFDTSLVKEAYGGGGYYVQLRTMKSLNYVESPRDKMKEIKIPILILKGQYDNQKWGLTHEYVDLFSNATLKVVPNAGHFIEIEQPEMYYKEILNFLR